MKRFLLRLLLLAGLVVVIDFGVGKVGDYLQTHPKGGITRRTNDLAMKECHDIVVMGSSRAHHHYDTPFLSDTLGLDAYNAGYNGCGIVLAYGLLEMMLERYRPKLVIFDVEPAYDLLVHSDDGNVRYISALKPYYRHPAVGEIIRSVSKEEWYKVHSGMLRYNSSLPEMGMDFFSMHGFEPKGFSPLDGVYEGLVSPRKESGEIDSLKLVYFEKFIKAAKKRSVPLLVVASPKLGVTDTGVLNPAKDICRQYSMPFSDYYKDSLFQHPSLFAEPTHLNARGARLFSECVSKDMLDNLDVR